MKNPVKVDLPNGRIVITRKFAEKAKTIGTDEFRYLQEIRMVHPDLEIVQEYNSTAFNMMKELRSMGMQIVIREEKERKACPTRLTYAQMEVYISCLDDAEKWLPIFEGVKDLSQSKKNRYNYVRQWFLRTFPEFIEEHSFNEEGKICHRAPSEEEIEEVA